MRPIRPMRRMIMTAAAAAMLTLTMLAAGCGNEPAGLTGDTGPAQAVERQAEPAVGAGPTQANVETGARAVPGTGERPNAPGQTAEQGGEGPKIAERPAGPAVTTPTSDDPGAGTKTAPVEMTPHGPAPREAEPQEPEPEQPAPQASPTQTPETTAQRTRKDMMGSAQDAPDMTSQGTAAAPEASSGGTMRGQSHASPPHRRPRHGDRERHRLPAAVTFMDYQRSRTTMTDDDPVSTFSLDTDRTSYQLALNWARHGYPVHPDSVRAEEWVNSFNYGYSPPDEPDRFAVSTDVTRHPLDGEGKLLVRIGMQAPEASAERDPLNVTIVMDASGSMAEGDRIETARAAATALRDNLDRDDRMAVLHFSRGVLEEHTVAHTRPDEPRLERSIAALRPTGSTNVQAGLDEGMRLAGRAARNRPEALNYIILMSDGVANVDATDPFRILRESGSGDDESHIRLITIGVGISNYNDHLLEQLAQHGDGWYRYLDTPEQARSTFRRDNWLRLSTPFADQARAQVTWNPEAVASWRILGYENRTAPDHQFTQERKEFAEIHSGAATTVFYEIETRTEKHDGKKHGDTPRLGAIELRWTDPETGASMSQGAEIADRGERNDQQYRSLLEFGAAAALAADRYGSMNALERRGRTEIKEQLEDLESELARLEKRLSRLDSYRDFRFLLEHMRESMPGRNAWGQPEIPKPRSGYSP